MRRGPSRIIVPHTRSPPADRACRPRSRQRRQPTMLNTHPSRGPQPLGKFRRRCPTVHLPCRCRLRHCLPRSPPSGRFRRRYPVILPPSPRCYRRRCRYSRSSPPANQAYRPHLHLPPPPNKNQARPSYRARPLGMSRHRCPVILPPSPCCNCCPPRQPKRQHATVHDIGNLSRSGEGRQARLADRSAREDRWCISKFPLARTWEILNSTA
jgi:hypothetical protein